MKKQKSKRRKPAQKSPDKTMDRQASGQAGVADRARSPFSVSLYIVGFAGLLMIAVGAVSGLKDLVEISPRLEKLAEWYLAAVEWPWRHICRLLGLKFYAEVAVQMTAYLSLMAVAFSSLWLEDKHGERPPNVGNKPAWREWWYKRQVLGFCTAIVASGLFVFATEHFVLGSGIAEAFTRYPVWYWSLHLLIAFVAFPLILACTGPRQVAECIAVGALCGMFVTLIWLPSAARAFSAGGEAVSHFRRGVLEFYIVRSISLGLVLGIALPRFMLAQLACVTMMVGLVVGASWLATR